MILGPILALEPEGQVPFLPSGWPDMRCPKPGAGSGVRPPCTGSCPKVQPDGQPLGCIVCTGSPEQGDQRLVPQSTP